MSSDQNPYEQMFSFVNEVFKNAGTDNSDLSVDEYAKRGPTMPKEAMEFLFGNTFNKLGLDAKTKLFLTLAGVLAQGMQSEQVLRQTIRHLREAEVSAENISEAIRTNVLATAMLAKLAEKFKSTCFVQISTDKAVEPSSVMGFTKKLAEIIIQTKDRLNKKHNLFF